MKDFICVLELHSSSHACQCDQAKKAPSKPSVTSCERIMFSKHSVSIVLSWFLLHSSLTIPEIATKHGLVSKQHRLSKTSLPSDVIVRSLQSSLLTTWEELWSHCWPVNPDVCAVKSAPQCQACYLFTRSIH